MTKGFPYFLECNDNHDFEVKYLDFDRRLNKGHKIYSNFKTRQEAVHQARIDFAFENGLHGLHRRGKILHIY